MNFASIDVGKKNMAVAFWINNVLDNFKTFEAINLNLLVENLNLMASHFQKCTHIFIEQQMKVNLNALKIQNQMEMFFKLIHPQIIVKTFPSRDKYKEMNRQLYQTKYSRKKWACNFAIQFIPNTFKFDFLKLKKKDDVADAIIIGATLVKNVAKYF
jgi:hypothetical protein